MDAAGGGTGTGRSEHRLYAVLVPHGRYCLVRVHAQPTGLQPDVDHRSDRHAVRPGEVGTVHTRSV